jgi:hypothetical protein
MIIEVAIPIASCSGVKGSSGNIAIMIFTNTVRKIKEAM